MKDKNDIHEFPIAADIKIGGDSHPVLIAGPCVIENEDMVYRHAEAIAQVAQEVGMPLIFKASYDKANRTSYKSYRGPGLKEGLRILASVKKRFNIPIITDSHSVYEIEAAGEVVDIVQIPAFLCRQTDLLVAAAETGKVVNVKKGQFLAPHDVGHIIDKIIQTGNEKIIITERGSCFGYNRLVVDFSGLVKMREFGFPIIFDATHSVQSPGGLGDKSGGDSEYAPYLAWAAAAVGVDGLFVEVHEDPAKALSDGANMIHLPNLKFMLQRFLRIASI